jgi:hypothetical protein
MLSGIAQILMASFWETPTGLQQDVFSAMGFAWKTGFGAIVGLLGGKQSNDDPSINRINNRTTERRVVPDSEFGRRRRKRILHTWCSERD